MRWDRLFDDLEAQLEAADDEQFEAEVSDRTRAEVARVHLIDRLRRSVGGQVDLTVDGAGDLRGVLRRVGRGWLLVDSAAGQPVVVAAHGLLAARALPVAAADPAATGAVESRLGLGHVLRAIARDRETVAVVLHDGSGYTGTIDRVGADFVDIAEHGYGEPRRPAGVSAVRTVAFAGISLVRTG